MADVGGKGVDKHLPPRAPSAGKQEKDKKDAQKKEEPKLELSEEDIHV